MSRRRRRRSSSAHYEEKALSASTWPTDLLSEPLTSGVSITPESALRVPAVSAAVNLIAGAVASLPMAIYKDDGQGKTLAEDHPGFDIVADAANEWTASSDLRKQLAVDAMLWGNGYALANRAPNGEIVELIHLRPGSVIVSYDPATSQPTYRWEPGSR